jgi:hypothetical protein
MLITKSKPLRLEPFGRVHNFPSASIILPFNPKMTAKAEINNALYNAMEQVEAQVRSGYPAEMCDLVMRKLKAVNRNLNFNTHKKSIAIYVSPVFEKVLYLDIAVEEKISVDETFEIRDLVYSKKQLHKYLALVLSPTGYRIYLGNSDSFVRILSNAPAQAFTGETDAERSNGADSTIAQHLFQRIDNSLNIIRNAYHLPLFVVGPARLIRDFSRVTRHRASVIDFVLDDHADKSMDTLQELLHPFVTDWQSILEKDLMHQIDAADRQRRLSFGIEDVWHHADRHNGMLLVIEKGYMHAAGIGSTGKLHLFNEPYRRFSYVKDAVDDAIEKVLENGGDVEFVDKGLLGDFQRIALVHSD